MAKNEQESIRAKAVFRDVVLDNRGVSLQRAMLNNGFSPAYASNPKQLTSTKQWQALLKKYLPDDLLAKRHFDMLNHKHYSAVLSSLHMAYKLKGKYLDDDKAVAIAPVQIVVSKLDPNPRKEKSETQS